MSRVRTRNLPRSIDIILMYIGSRITNVNDSDAENKKNQLMRIYKILKYHHE